MKKLLLLLISITTMTTQLHCYVDKEEEQLKKNISTSIAYALKIPFNSNDKINEFKEDQDAKLKDALVKNCKCKNRYWTTKYNGNPSFDCTQYEKDLVDLFAKARYFQINDDAQTFVNAIKLLKYLNKMPNLEIDQSDSLDPSEVLGAAIRTILPTSTTTKSWESYGRQKDRKLLKNANRMCRQQNKKWMEAKYDCEKFKQDLATMLKERPCFKYKEEKPEV